MPNWTANRIYIGGEERDLREFLDAVRSQDQIFDFNRIVPMPELLRRTGKGGRTIAGQYVSSWYIIHEGSLEKPEEVRAFYARGSSRAPRYRRTTTGTTGPAPTGVRNGTPAIRPSKISVRLNTDIWRLPSIRLGVNRNRFFVNSSQHFHA